MSYVSGFMLGASIGKAVHSFLHGSPQSTATPGRGFVTAPQNVRTAPPTNCVTPAFACVSSLPGRRRYRAAALVGNASLADLLQEGLEKVKGITSVQVNVTTGGILICAEDDSVFKRVEVFLEGRFFLSPCVRETMARPQMPHRQPASEYKHTLQEVMGTMSDYIYERTHRLFDLRSLVSFILIVRGIRRMVTLDEMPSGPQMLWWAVALLRGK